MVVQEEIKQTKKGKKKSGKIFTGSWKRGGMTMWWQPSFSMQVMYVTSKTVKTNEEITIKLAGNKK